MNTQAEILQSAINGSFPPYRASTVLTPEHSQGRVAEYLPPAPRVEKIQTFSDDVMKLLIRGSGEGRRYVAAPHDAVWAYCFYRPPQAIGQPVIGMLPGEVDR